MRVPRIAISAVFAAMLAALPISAAKAQYYAPCSPFPLAWPFCAAGAVVGTAATIATAPFWLLSGTRPYAYGYYAYGYPAPPYYPAASYYAPAYYAPPSSTYAPPPPQAAPGQPVPPPPPTTHAPAGYAPPPARDAYYFCPTSKRYYPYVATCPVAWRPVPIIPPK